MVLIDVVCCCLSSCRPSLTSLPCGPTLPPCNDAGAAEQLIKLHYKIITTYWVLQLIILTLGGSTAGRWAIACCTNSSPLTSRTYPHTGNHLACSVQGSSSGSQCRSPPSQWKHRTWSLEPETYVAQNMHNTGMGFPVCCIPGKPKYNYLPTW
jgi:hypothetical protein